MAKQDQEGVVPVSDADGQIRVAERLEALGTLAGGLAHDLNNILTVIVTTTDLVLKHMDEDAPNRAELATIAQAATRGGELARRLLAFGQLDPRRRRALDLARLVENSIPTLARLVGARVRIVPELELGLPAIVADPVQLEQVLLNLVVNASDAMPAGGRVTIHARAVHLDADRRRALELGEGDCVELAVSDTGTGLAANIVDRVWEPFFTTKEGKGTGLGLSAVRRIVADHGGAIEVESKPDQGATFRIWLVATG